MTAMNWIYKSSFYFPSKHGETSAVMEDDPARLHYVTIYYTIFKTTNQDGVFL